MKDLFIQAIQNFSKVRISFYSLEDRKILVRICAPLDFGPSRRAKEKKKDFMDVPNPRRVLAVSLDSHAEHLSKIIHGE